MFQLVFGEHDLSLTLPLDAHIEDQLTMLVALDVEANVCGKAPRSKLAALIAEAITAVVDPSHAPSSAPTWKQVRYALGICHALDLNLPQDVLRDRAAMTRFLNRYAEKYRARYRELRDQKAPVKRS